MSAEKFENMELWPRGESVPFAVAGDTTDAEKRVMGDDGIIRITDVSVPTLSFYPASGKGPHPAVLVCPGGGYSILAWNHEGTDVAGWLNANGISAFILKYRCPERKDAAKADATRAMRLIRANAAQYSVLPDKIGIIGFSAGAHLSACVCNLAGAEPYPAADAFDAVDPRPDFAFLIYPAYLWREGWKLAPETTVTEKTSPTFLLSTQDDKLSVDGSISYFIAMKAAGVPAEIHVFPSGGHGYGLLRKDAPSDAWPSLAINWFSSVIARSKSW